MGSQVSIPFSGYRYDSVYQCMKALMAELEGNTYHRRKFERHLKLIARQGRLVIYYYYYLCLTY